MGIEEVLAFYIVGLLMAIGVIFAGVTLALKAVGL